MKSISVQVPASAANLGPGFDCLALALDLVNTFEFSLLSSGLTISNEGYSDNLPQDESNLLAVAFYHLADQADQVRPGLNLHTISQVPPKSGLGSSTTAIVAGLLAANQLLKLDLANEQLLDHAAELEGHADNAAAALFGGLVAVNQIGGGWQHHQLPLSPLKTVVVVPQVSISTQQMRTALPVELSTEVAVANAACLVSMIEALGQADFHQMRQASQVSFHQEVRLPLIPGGQQALEAGRAAGAAVVLAGAGPGLLALAPNHHSEIAQAMQEAFRSAGVESEVYFLQSRLVGATINSHFEG